MSKRDSEVLQVDLSEYGAKVFTGRPNGVRAREHFNLTTDQRAGKHVVIRVPDETLALNSSFLLGFLGEEIRAAGSRDKFMETYQFKMPEKFNEQLERTIIRALLREKSQNTVYLPIEH